MKPLTIAPYIPEPNDHSLVDVLHAHYTCTYVFIGGQLYRMHTHGIEDRNELINQYNLDTTNFTI
jgi:hypothetical protein